MTATVAPGKVIVSAVIEETQRNELLRLARDADHSLSAEVRRAVAAHLEAHDPHEEPSP